MFVMVGSSGFDKMASSILEIPLNDLYQTGCVSSTDDEIVDTVTYSKITGHHFAPVKILLETETKEFEIIYHPINIIVDEVYLSSNNLLTFFTKTTENNSELSVIIPRELLDSKTLGVDLPYKISINDKLIPLKEIDESNSDTDRIVHLFLPSDVSKIEFKGNSIGNSIKYPIINSIFPETIFSLPSWIKTNAGWWAGGAISDSDFVEGIQFLIKEGIMKI